MSVFGYMAGGLHTGLPSVSLVTNGFAHIVFFHGGDRSCLLSWYWPDWCDVKCQVLPILGDCFFVRQLLLSIE